MITGPPSSAFTVVGSSRKRQKNVVCFTSLLLESSYNYDTNTETKKR